MSVERHTQSLSGGSMMNALRIVFLDDILIIIHYEFQHKKKQFFDMFKGQHVSLLDSFLFLCCSLFYFLICLFHG